MLKLMKYELRKMRTMLLIMLIALAALEAGFLVGSRLGITKVEAVCLALLSILAFTIYIYILISGIVSYNRELNNRTGYMTFMVPVSPMGIVGSKLLFTVLAAVGVTALFGGVLYLDYAMEFRKLNLNAVDYEQLSMVFSMYMGSLGGAFSLSRILLAIAYTAGTVLISIILAMCTAYLAITLSATVLQNRKGAVRGLVSFLFFLALNYLSSWVTGRIADAGAPLAASGGPESLAMLARMLGVNALVELAFAILFAAGSAVLLDRKVSL